MDDIDPSGIKKMHLIMTIKITYGLWVEILTIFKIIIDLYGFRIYIYIAPPFLGILVPETMNFHNLCRGFPI